MHWKHCQEPWEGRGKSCHTHEVIPRCPAQTSQHEALPIPLAPSPRGHPETIISFSAVGTVLRSWLHQEHLGVSVFHLNTIQLPPQPKQEWVPHRAQLTSPACPAHPKPSWAFRSHAAGLGQQQPLPGASLTCGQTVAPLQADPGDLVLQMQGKEVRAQHTRALESTKPGGGLVSPCQELSACCLPENHQLEQAGGPRPVRSKEGSWLQTLAQPGVARQRPAGHLRSHHPSCEV